MAPSLFCAVVRIPIAALSVALAACGGDPPPSPEAQVRAKLAQLTRATDAKDYEQLCDEVFSSVLTSRTEAIGLGCPAALRRAFADVRDPQIQVGEVTVTDGTARAQVRSSAAGQPPSRDTVELRRETGGWRVVSLAGQGGTPSPTPDAQER
jgi:hypothetical protein